MDSFWNISIGEVAIATIALLALIAASIIGALQNRINKRLLSLQDSVELYITHGIVTSIDMKDEALDAHIPAIIIKNLSTKMIYLHKYIYNGVEYLIHDHVLPPAAQLVDACYHIQLPTNGSEHVSFHIFFSDWAGNKWETSGYADLINRQWKITNIPCKRV